MVDVRTAVAAAAFTPWGVWWGTHALLAVAGRRPPSTVDGARRFDVVVPAHDEERALPTLLRSLADQEPASLVRRVLVVADHCSDRTAEVARSMGVEVLVRDDGVPGKPPAIRAGVEVLASDRGDSDGVVVLDADCTCAPGFAAHLTARLGADDEVVQAAYTILEPSGEAVRGGLRRAFALRNVVRTAGADRLGLPVVLTGSGILLRWSALDRLSYGNSQVGFTGRQPAGADLVMALDLLEAGIHARFAADALVTAPPPDDDRALATQRLRWEGGQVVNWRRAARLAGRLARRGDWRGVLGLVDWMAPPLSAMVAAHLTLTAAAGAAAAAGLVGASLLLAPAVTFGSLVLYLAVGIARLEGPRGVLDTALGAPRFLTWKAGLYLAHAGRGDGKRATGA